MNQKQNNFFSRQTGFTIIELMVVISIMAMLMTVIVISYANQRKTRSAVLAQNETITNIKKVQSYILSSRNISADTPAKYYILKFRSGEATYEIQAIDNAFVLHQNVETVSFPSDTILHNLEFLDSNAQPIGGGLGWNTSKITCVDVIFSAPFGKMFINDNPKCNESLTDLVKNPAAMYEIDDLTLRLTVGSLDTTKTKTIDLHGITGRIDAN
jgi:prepilin-type N-terminal cleavage/methylation domain-containing protein